MPKLPDFSKFDLQSIVNSVKSIITPEAGTPNVSPGDPIGTKIVQVSTLLQSLARTHAQSAKDLTQINNLLNELYKDLEAFRTLQKEGQGASASDSVSDSPEEETQSHPKDKSNL